MIEGNFLFYQTEPSKENTGNKLVLWEVDGPEGKVFDWGFSEWTGTEWGIPEVPEGYTIKVKIWANTLDPKILLSPILRVS